MPDLDHIVTETAVDAARLAPRPQSSPQSPQSPLPLPKAGMPLDGPADDADFAVLLLMALRSMAARSNRRQADVVAALRGAGLTVDVRRVRAALRVLQAQGAVENLVPLSDGGLLLSVTQAGAENFGDMSDWLAPDSSN